MKWSALALAILSAVSAGCRARGDLYRWDGDRLAAGMTPDHILCHGGRIYLADNARILSLDERTGRLLWQFDNVSKHPAFHSPTRQGTACFQRGRLHPCWIGSIAVAGGRLFANEIFAGNLMVFDLDEPGPPTRLKMPDQGQLAAAPSGSEVYYASNEAAFYRIDARSLEPLRVPYPTGAKGIGGVLAGPDGRKLYLAIQRGARKAGAEAPPTAAGPSNPLKQLYSGPLLAEYDLAEDRYDHLASIGDTRFERGDDASIPTSLSLSEDGRSLYVTLCQCGIGVHVYDVGDHCLRVPLALPDAPGGNWPNCWRSAQIGKGLYVTLGHQTHLVRVSLADGSITRMGASGKAICRSGTSLYVAAPGGIRRINHDKGTRATRPAGLPAWRETAPAMAPAESTVKDRQRRGAALPRGGQAKALVQRGRGSTIH